MTQTQNVSIARDLLAALAEGRRPEAVATLFDDDVLFEIPGDTGVLPWIGHRTGRSAVTHFIASTRAMTELLTFDVEEVLASDARAVIVGELASRMKATDKVVETAFAIVLTISGDRIIRFQMLEDSFAVSLAARA
ncbi:MAG: nuclear transport factor 2 family protein [Rhodospirillales bacterium]|nr:nuclear transport factor 2 family protein [Rhodospirillales bacterium]